MKTILIVDNEKIPALALQRHLQILGYSVLTAHSAMDAISLIKEYSSIDLILMDIKLGKGIDGTEAALMILSIRDIPIIFISAHTEKDMIYRTEDINSYGYVLKDSPISIYHSSIKSALNLYTANLEKQRANTLLQSSLDYLPQAIFISDTNGKLTFYNDAFVKIQKFNTKSECIRILTDYPDIFDVYNAEGVPAKLQDWALPRALRAEKRENVPYYIVRKDIKDIWVGSYSFGPIMNDKGEIISGIVSIEDITDSYKDNPVLNKLKGIYKNL